MAKILRVEFAGASGVGNPFGRTLGSEINSAQLELDCSVVRICGGLLQQVRDDPVETTCQKRRSSLLLRGPVDQLGLGSADTGFLLCHRALHARKQHHTRDTKEYNDAGHSQHTP